MGRPEVILRVGASGGSLTLLGLRTSSGWLFSRKVMDQTPGLLDEPWIMYTSEAVPSLGAALNLFDKYPWTRLFPIEVHPEFRASILKVVEGRNERSTVSEHVSLEWRKLCGRT